MKKQNVNNKLAFNKAAVTELNQNELADVNGGSITISFIILATAAVTAAVVDYFIEEK